MAIFKAALLLGLALKLFIVAVRIKWRVDVNQVDARCWKFSQLVEIVAAINNTRIDECRRPCGHLSHFAESEASGQRADDRDNFERLKIASIDLRDAKVMASDQTIARTSRRETFTVRCNAPAPVSSRSATVR